MLSHMLSRIWLVRGVMAIVLLPLTFCFWAMSRVRFHAYMTGFFKRERLPVPVVVVGNIIVGGSGKTPLTLWLADALRKAGWQPGIVSRGYAAAARTDHAESAEGVREVRHDSPAYEVGDEPLLLKRRSGVPVFVGRDRVAAGRALLAAYPHCDLILSDDGLQHYRLLRDVEIALVDARGFMNGWLLPSGPLRESPQRLAGVDALVLNGASTPLPATLKNKETSALPWLFRMRLTGAHFMRLDASDASDASNTTNASDGLDGLDRLATVATPADLAHLRLAAVCGIAVPERFFQHLETLGLNFTRHVFPDHHAYTMEDLLGIQQQTQADALLMTEKDAVKCSAYKGCGGCAVWVLPVTAELESGSSCMANIDLVTLIEQRLAEKPIGSPTT